MSGHCFSCGMGGGNGSPAVPLMEMFTNWSPATIPSDLKGCAIKGQSCQYTAQGELVCGGAGSQGPLPHLVQDVTFTGTPLFEGFVESTKVQKVKYQ